MVAPYNFGTASRIPVPAFTPFNVAGMSPVQREYFNTTPQAVFGSFMNQFRPTGPGAASMAFRQFAERWLPDQYNLYQGAVAHQPEMTFMDFLNQQSRDLGQQYKFALSTRPIVRPTRLLRS